MAGIRGVRNPVPTKGEKPTGIFSTRGSQKKDDLGSAYKPELTGSNLRKPRVDPKPRDNGLK